MDLSEFQIIVSLITITISLSALVISGWRLIIAIYPIWIEHRNEKILKKKFSRGPYDQATIERSTRFYIRPKCTNIDPAQEKEMRHALIATREDLFDKLDHYCPVIS